MLLWSNIFMTTVHITNIPWYPCITLNIPELHLSLPTPDDGSSMSDVSAISNTSNKTYVSEDSSLVLETLESGRHHHYLIPMAAARRAKLKKAGTKLHIYMDHIFTAQHIKL